MYCSLRLIIMKTMVLLLNNYVLFIIRDAFMRIEGI